VSVRVRQQKINRDQPGETAMKLVRFNQDAAGIGTARIGKLVGGKVIEFLHLPGGSSMRALLTDYQTLEPALQAAEDPAYDLGAIRLLAPIDDPQKFLAIGMNYQAHADEAAAAGIPIPTSQLWFNKQVSCITGPYDAIELPVVSDQLDYEAEMAVVIGKACRHVKESEARGVIAGYMVTNDVTVRDWQRKSPTYTLGKSFDTHGPLGPWLTTDDEITDPHALEMVLTVNGEERQRDVTSGMIYNIFQQISYLSTVMTLLPGDVLATGTPAGVGIARGTFLRDGDVVRVDIAGLGSIENTVRAERRGA
jgi:2-keto-4-pentenoate hydratase/2-oxohepta-3-ene-1,7-dioic acid hydratase in catechol pathway